MKKSRLVVIGISLVVLASTATVWWYAAQETQHACHFSEQIRHAASGMQLYCFDTAKLPSGVTSDPAQAIRKDSAIIFSAKDGNDTIAVSLQTKPSEEKIKTFVQKVIPLYLETSTPVGTAASGISGEQSITSLPTSSTTWIIVTAPKAYDSNRLSQLLRALGQD